MTVKYFVEKDLGAYKGIPAIAKFDIDDDGFAYTEWGSFCSPEHLESNWVEIDEKKFEAVADLIEDIQSREKEIAKIMSLQSEMVGLTYDVISGISSGKITFFYRGEQPVQERNFGFRIIS